MHRMLTIVAIFAVAAGPADAAKKRNKVTAGGQAPPAGDTGQFNSQIDFDDEQQP